LDLGFQIPKSNCCSCCSIVCFNVDLLFCFLDLGFEIQHKQMHAAISLF